ncbi:MAG: hypothetical protein KIH08_14905 [Candidatus Freyarchaeota archaeon]|nr:hypothetical protein [Candidatus Jordarchaeia archaeon]
MKTAEMRIAKYKAKFDPEVARIRFSAIKDLAGTQQEARQSELADLMSQVRDILNANAVPRLFTVVYTSFANKLYSISRVISGSAFQTEATQQANIWVQQGAIKDVINQILAIFGVSPLP